MEEILQKISSGDRRTTAKFITECENSYDFLKSAAEYIYPMTGKVKTVGIAGSFGVGKSTLIDGLIKSARKENYRVGIIAVDPSSPFTGGAILGDRIRMNRHFLDEGVFIRSISSLESITPEVLIISRILELWGADIIFIETAGLGQTQVEVSAVSDIVMLLLQPHVGDDIQLMKSGIMEIAHIIAITKCDIFDGYLMKSVLMSEFKRAKVFETGMNMEENYNILLKELMEFKGEKKDGRDTVKWLIMKKFRDELLNRLLSKKMEEGKNKFSDPFNISDDIYKHIIIE